VNGPRPSGAEKKSGKDASASRVLIDFALPSEPGNERLAMELVATAVRDLGLPLARLERLKTAVAEATMNAMEHGNVYRPEAPVKVRVRASADELVVAISDQGSGAVPNPDAVTPDLEAKLQGLQKPRGWGLFLIQNMVDEMNITASDAQHTVELVMYLQVQGQAQGQAKGDDDAGKTA
jgi:anti-sigma regulatory factor (Ser/Thr protein kinase)